MKDERRRHAPHAAQQPDLRPPYHGVPTLHIEIALESQGRITLEARSREDELALRAWLRRTRRLEYLQHALVRLLDDMDAADVREAA